MTKTKTMTALEAAVAYRAAVAAQDAKRMRALQQTLISGLDHITLVDLIYEFSITTNETLAMLDRFIQALPSERDPA